MRASPVVVGPIDSIRLGFVGAPIASCISINLMFITMFLYSIFCAPRDAWGGWTPADLLSGFGLNIKLGLAGIGMVGSEWWSWEIVGLATSFLGPTALAAQSVLREWFMSLFLLFVDDSVLTQVYATLQSRRLRLSISSNTRLVSPRQCASAVSSLPHMELIGRYSNPNAPRC